MILHHLHIGEYPVDIVQSEEGDTYASFDFPLPSPEEADRIESYLTAEGFLQKKNVSVQTETKKFTVFFKDGTTESYRLEDAEILAFDQPHGCATILLGGKAFELENVKGIETPTEV